MQLVGSGYQLGLTRLAVVRMVAMGMSSANIAGSEPKFLQRCHFGDLKSLSMLFEVSFQSLFWKCKSI